MTANHRAWGRALGLSLLLGAVALAGEVGYVISNNARLVNQKRNLGARTVAQLRLNQRLELLEGEVGDATWVKARTADGKEGYLFGNTLREEPLEGVPGDMQPNDRRYTQNVGAAAKGWNKGIEDRKRRGDADYDRALRRIEAWIELIDDRVRKPARPPGYHERLDAFYREGKLEPQPFRDGQPEED